jgi:hypothetical protein
MRGWVCHLQLLLALASTVIPRSESRGTHNHILQSQIRDSPTWRGKSPYLFLYPLGIGWPSYTPRHWVPFSSPPTTRRATVGVFEPASTRGLLKAPIRFPVYSLGADPTENTASNSCSFVACATLAPITCWLSTAA